MSDHIAHEGEAMEARLNETIRLLLTRTGRSQGNLAEALGVKRPSLSQRLRGESRWLFADVVEAANYFGLTLAELSSGYAAIAQAGRLPAAKGSEGQTSI